MGNITTGDVQRFYNGIANQRTHSTANRYLTLLRLLFNKAKLWGNFYQDNPCTGIKKGREAAPRLRYLSAEEIQRLLLAAHPRLYPVLVCAVLTGMRRGEILGMDWEHVNFEQGTIYVPKTKSGKPRFVPLATKLREVLLSLGPQPQGRVFDLPIIMLRRYFDRAVRAAGIREFLFHDLRHTFASHFIMKTSDMPTLQQILGHSSPAMTLRYAHLSRGHLASEMALFESAITVNPPVSALAGHQVRHQPQITLSERP